MNLKTNMQLNLGDLVENQNQEQNKRLPELMVSVVDGHGEWINKGRRCRIDGCFEQSKAYGTCQKHYRRYKVRKCYVAKPKLRDDIFKHTNKIKSGCWEWTGANRGNGYGALTINGKLVSAHRVAYEKIKGKIPAGLHIDHLCRNRICINPEHLEAVTHRENLIRGINFQRNKTHCSNGHEYNEKNTFITKENTRKCKACQAAIKRIYYLKIKDFIRQKRILKQQAKTESKDSIN